MPDHFGIDNLVGHSLRGYRVMRQIDRGGMGVIFEGLQESLGRRVAIKVLYPHLSGDVYFRERFEREARTTAGLIHPNIVRVLDFGYEDQLYFMVMDLVDGESLRERLARVHAEGLMLQMDTILSIVKQVGNGLSYAHRRGYVHRDVKPGNILLTRDGQAFLTDFGVVKILDSVQVTTHGMIIGTPEYMAPEQSSGEGEIGVAADQYSLAVVAYEMMVGRVPFRAPTPVAVMQLHLTEPPPAPSSVIPWFPPQVEAVLMRALSKRPEERFESVDAFVNSLVTAINPEPVHAIPPPPARAMKNTPLPVAAGPSTGPIPALAHDGMPEGATSSAVPHSGSRRFVMVGGLATLAVIAAVAGLLRMGLPMSSRAENESPQSGRAPDTTPMVASPTIAVSVAATPTLPPTAAAVLSATAPVYATATSQSSAPPAAASPTAPVILFSSHRGEVHDSQVYVMHLDGTMQRQVTTNRGHTYAPRVSPDGRRLMYSSVAPGEHASHGATGGSGTTSPGNHDVYVADLSGSDEMAVEPINVVNLTRGSTSWDNGWSWSPDGKRIAFASDRDGNWEIYTMTASGSELQRITNNPAEDGWPVWTPDGKSIVFASLRAGNEEIYVVDADGTEQNARRLTSRPDTMDTYPAVSPDGKKIVFSSQYPNVNEGQIYSMNLDGSDVRRLTNAVALNSIPSWCPDGAKIVFVSDRDGNDNIYIMDATGANEKRLTDDSGEDTTPSCAYINPAAP